MLQLKWLQFFFWSSFSHSDYFFFFTVPRTPTTIGIIVTFMSHNFFDSIILQETSFSRQFFFLWNPSDSKFLQISSTHVSICANFGSAVVLTFQFFHWSSFLLVSFPWFFYCSKYEWHHCHLHIPLLLPGKVQVFTQFLLLTFNFTLMLAETAKLTKWQVLLVN